MHKHTRTLARTHTNSFSTQFDALFSHQISMSNRSFGWVEFGRRQRRIHLLSFRKYHSIPHNWWWCFCTLLSVAASVTACAYKSAHTSIYACLFIHLNLFVLFLFYYLFIYIRCLSDALRRFSAEQTCHSVPHSILLITPLSWFELFASTHFDFFVFFCQQQQCLFLSLRFVSFIILYACGYSFGSCPNDDKTNNICSAFSCWQIFHSFRFGYSFWIFFSLLVY